VPNLLQAVDLGCETWSTPAVGLAGGPHAVVVTGTRAGEVVAIGGADRAVRWRRFLGEVITASPTLADVDADGAREVVLGAEDGWIYALRLEDGSEVWRQRCGEAIRATAAVGDVDGDGQAEVLVGAYGTWMYCLDGRTGAVKWRRYLPKHEFYGGTKRGVVSSPLIADVDLDGESEIVTGIRSRRIYCLGGKSGRLKWYRELKYDPDSSPSFARVNGRAVVFVGGGEHTSGAGDNALIALSGFDGAEFWRAGVGGGIDSSPIVADLRGDGQLDVVATSLADASCYAVDATTGEVRWAYRFGPTSACVHDARNVCRPGPDAGYFTEHAVCRSYTTPLIADVDSDGRPEVVVGSNNGTLAVLDGRTGAAKWTDRTGGLVRGSPVLADLDGDGLLEMVVPSGRSLRIYRTAATAGAWEMFKGRPDHPGCLAAPETQPPRRPAPHRHRRSFQWPRLVWHWLVVDGARYLLFQLDRRILSPLGMPRRGYFY
jgi:outer membrane protein assembly factor BamB